MISICLVDIHQTAINIIDIQNNELCELFEREFFDIEHVVCPFLYFRGSKYYTSLYGDDIYYYSYENINKYLESVFEKLVYSKQLIIKKFRESYTNPIKNYKIAVYKA